MTLLILALLFIGMAEAVADAIDSLTVMPVLESTQNGFGLIQDLWAVFQKHPKTVAVITAWIFGEHALPYLPVKANGMIGLVVGLMRNLTAKK